MRERFPRTFDSLERIFRFAGEFLSREAIDERHHYAVNFALEEIFTNMVKYNPGNSNEILIRMERQDDRLSISLTDFDVDPFDVTQVEEARTDLPLEQRKVGGLGLHLTRKVMDSVDYEYADRRSTITLTKKLR